jgi:hypothetical protein
LLVEPKFQSNWCVALHPQNTAHDISLHLTLELAPELSFFFFVIYSGVQDYVGVALCYAARFPTPYSAQFK